MWRQLSSLRGRLTVLLALASVAGALIYAGVTQWPLPQLLTWLHDQLAVKVEPSAVRTAMPRAGTVRNGSTSAKCTAGAGRYGTALASTPAPWFTSCGCTRCSTSMTVTSG